MYPFTAPPFMLAMHIGSHFHSRTRGAQRMQYTAIIEQVRGQLFDQVRALHSTAQLTSKSSSPFQLW